jgi:uncharacterized membrane protein
MANASTEVEHVPKHYFVAFAAASFGYMLPWTALGSLISYYKNIHGADFYVMIYCLYYLPGLPIAMLQYRYDDLFDNTLSSQRAYLLRGILGYVTMVCVIFAMIWYTDKASLMVGFLLLGITGWLCHGTASMLAAMYPVPAIACLQIGFRVPEIYSLLLVSALDLKSTATEAQLQSFHAITAFVVLSASLAWVMLVLNPTSATYFGAKDARLRDAAQEITESSGSNSKPGDEEVGLLDWASETDAWGGDGVEFTTFDNNRHRRNHTTSDRGSKDDIDKYSCNNIAFSAVIHKDSNHAKILPLCAALAISVFSSIFHAAFFAYVSSDQDKSIEQTLYFVRLFADLCGRPLTFLPRPWFLQVRRGTLIVLLAVWSYSTLCKLRVACHGNVHQI